MKFKYLRKISRNLYSLMQPLSGNQIPAQWIVPHVIPGSTYSKESITAGKSYEKFIKWSHLDGVAWYFAINVLVSNTHSISISPKCYIVFVWNASIWLNLFIQINPRIRTKSSIHQPPDWRKNVRYAKQKFENTVNIIWMNVSNPLVYKKKYLMKKHGFLVFQKR